MLEIDVRKRLGRFVLEMRFRAPARGITALFGRSGSGKTSVLAAIAGLARPDAGRIAVGDTVLFDSERGVDVRPELRRVG